MFRIIRWRCYPNVFKAKHLSVSITTGRTSPQTHGNAAETQPVVEIMESLFDFFFIVDTGVAAELMLLAY